MIDFDAIPAELTDKETLAGKLLTAGATAKNSASIIAAKAKRDNFTNDRLAAAKWIREQFKLDSAGACHYAAVGNLLLHLREENKYIFERIITCDYDKVLILTGLRKMGQVVALLQDGRFDRMTRQELRDWVRRKNGVKFECKERVEQPFLPGLLDGLDGLLALPDEDNLQQIAQHESFDSRRALKLGLGGVGGLKVALYYWEAHPEEVDAAKLGLLHQSYTDELARIEALEKRLEV